MLLSRYCTWIISAILTIGQSSVNFSLGRLVSTNRSGIASYWLQNSSSKMSNLLPSGFIASDFEQYNIDNLYDSTPHLHRLFSSRQEPTCFMASQITLFGDSTVNTKSIHGVCPAFGFSSPAKYLAHLLSCTRATKRGITVLWVWSIFAFHY